MILVTAVDPGMREGGIATVLIDGPSKRPTLAECELVINRDPALPFVKVAQLYADRARAQLRVVRQNPAFNELAAAPVFAVEVTGYMGSSSNSKAVHLTGLLAACIVGYLDAVPSDPREWRRALAGSRYSSRTPASAEVYGVLRYLGLEQQVPVLPNAKQRTHLLDAAGIAYSCAIALKVEQQQVLAKARALR